MLTVVPEETFKGFNILHESNTLVLSRKGFGEVLHTRSSVFETLLWVLLRIARSLVCVMNETTQNHDDEKSFSIAEHAI